MSAANWKFLLLAASALAAVTDASDSASASSKPHCSPPSELYSPLVQQKVLATAQTVKKPPAYPEYTDRTVGDWLYFSPNTWTTGFFPTTLYALHERQQLCPSSGTNTSETDWLALGREWSAAEVPLEHNNTLEHDVGFVSFPFQEELKVNPENQTAITAVNAFAQDLAARFSPIVGCTRSWDNDTDPSDFIVIIDNMMNLEVFFASNNLTSNQTLVDMAISHADKTMENHVRPDGSSYHVVDYNATTGVVIDRRTSQGYAANSTWSRGQSWGIYGFAQMYQSTGYDRYLETSRRMATYFVEHLPSNGIVPWDFNAPLVPPRPADSSAAMIASNALFLLSQLELQQSPPNITGSDFWLESALKIITDNTALAWRPSWQSLLANGTVNNPAKPPNNLTGIVYGDYYFVKAGNTLIELGLAECPQ